MRQTRSVILGGVNRARKIDRFRRRAWVQRRVYLRSVEPPVELQHVHVREHIPGEYPEPPKSKVLAVIRRGIGLTSDMVVLLLFSPFFALWLLYRGAVRVMRGKN